jgi:hypothetical protein
MCGFSTCRERVSQFVRKIRKGERENRERERERKLAVFGMRSQHGINKFRDGWQNYNNNNNSSSNEKIALQ